MRVPGDFEVVAQRKGFQRYRSPELTELVAAHAAAVQQKETCLAATLQVCPAPSIPLATFSRRSRPLRDVVESIYYTYKSLVRTRGFQGQGPGAFRVRDRRYS